MTTKKTFLLLFLFALCTNFKSYEEDIELIKLEDYKVTFLDALSNAQINDKIKKTKHPGQGMTFCKLQVLMQNESATDATIDLEDSYLMDEKRNVYYASHLGAKTKNQTTFKPFETKSCALYFEFPKGGQPTKLVIEKRPFLLQH